MVDSRWVVTASTASAAELERRFEEAWGHLQRAAPTSERDSPRAQLLAQPWSVVLKVEDSPEQPMGVAGGEGEFLIVLRDVATYVTDALAAAAAERLVAEVVDWLKRRYGAGSIKLRDDEQDRP